MVDDLTEINLNTIDSKFYITNNIHGNKKVVDIFFFFQNKNCL